MQNLLKTPTLLFPLPLIPVVGGLIRVLVGNLGIVSKVFPTCSQEKLEPGCSNQPL